MEFTAKLIASYLQGEIVGNENATVNTFAKIEEGASGAISFLSNPKYTHYLYTTQSTIILVNKDIELEQEVSATLIKVDNAYEALAKLLNLYEESKPQKKGISTMAYIDPTAKLGKDVYIAPFAYIGEGVSVGENTKIYPHTIVCDGATIGDNCILYPNVTVYHDCRIGAQCILHSGSVIGADGFGHAPTPTGYDKIPQIGIVILEDRVEVGANTCIDRATMGATIIHTGVKLDNLIQIAHNDKIGAHTVMAAQCGVAGSTEIGEWCMVGGQVGFAGHIKICDHTSIGAQSGVPKSITQPNQAIMGSPSFEGKQFAKSSAVFKKLPEMYSELASLKRELDALKEKLRK